MLLTIFIAGLVGVSSQEERAVSPCINVFNVSSISDGWWQGNIRVYTSVATTSWTMVVTLSLPVTSFVVYNSAYNTTDNKVFTLTSYSWSGTLAAGALLDTQFQVYFPVGTAAPDVIGVKFQAEEKCSGASSITSTSTPTTTARPTTAAPVASTTSKATTATVKQTTTTAKPTAGTTVTTKVTTASTKPTVTTTKPTTSMLTTRLATNTTTAKTTPSPTTVTITSTSIRPTSTTTRQQTSTTRPTITSTTTKQSVTTTTKSITTEQTTTTTMPTTTKQTTTTSKPTTTLVKSTTTITPKRQGAKLEARSDGLYYNNQKVFLSGVNLAWYYYGFDFGNNQYNSAGPTLESWLDQISGAGGNSVRVWLHVEGDNTPQFDASGFVTAPDRDGTLISDMRRFLDYAKMKNILVVFVLWNGALMRNQKVVDLIWDDSKLQSYIDNVLKPMASQLAGHPALGAWEIVNELEGSVRVPETQSNPCFDTNALQGSGAGWTGKSIPMERFLRFYNWQLAALREADPTTILTGGSWSEKSQNSAFGGSYNYYTNECLVAAGGGSKPSGTIDFYQMHTYAFKDSNGQYKWNPSAPFNGNTAASYALNKPLVLGEFATACSQGESIQNLMDQAYNNGFAGAWIWSFTEEFGGECADSRATQLAGLNQLRGRTDKGVVNFTVG